MRTGNVSQPRTARVSPARRFTDVTFRMAPRPSARPHDGFTYIGILIAVAIVGVALATTGVVWHTAQKRERERQLLFVGDQFRKAIGRYYNVGAGVGAAGQYPRRLSDLVRDPRLLGVARYIRKIYYDPITGTRKWGLIKSARGGILGVYSLSEEHPIKQTNFSAVDRDFEGKTKYSQWVFIYSPKKTPSVTSTSSLPAPNNATPKRPQ